MLGQRVGKPPTYATHILMSIFIWTSIFLSKYVVKYVVLLCMQDSYPEYSSYSNASSSDVRTIQTITGFFCALIPTTNTQWSIADWKQIPHTHSSQAGSHRQLLLPVTHKYLSTAIQLWMLLHLYFRLSLTLLTSVLKSFESVVPESY